jgi:hypothetical protein
MPKLFQINEEDLATLEHTLPQLQDALFPELANPLVAPRLRVQLRRVKDILSNVRWNYGPPMNVEIIPAGGDAPAPPPTP